jgi:NADPH-dependent 2,4-dienoyl-CoA reductase/sulfur reductase-like enzyme
VLVLVSVGAMLLVVVRLGILLSVRAPAAKLVAASFAICVMLPRSVDIFAAGAGPAGLYAAYYAGFRGLTVGLVDTLPEPGGQVSALYPEKLIYDIAS